MLKEVNPKTLKPHPKNIEIYGSEDITDLKDSIASKGVLENLTINKQNIVISGHSRLQAALELELDSVPVRVIDVDDELEILELLIHNNKGRVKTNEQIAREAKELLEIEKVKAKERQSALNGKTQLPQNSAEAKEKGEARQKVAEKIGKSRDSVAKMVDTVTAIDKMKEQGRGKEAEHITKTLNKSVNKAYKLAKESGFVEEKQVKKPKDTPKPKEVKPAKESKSLELASQPSQVRSLNYILLDDWNKSPDLELLSPELVKSKTGKGFNEQKSNDIEWAKWSWNPVTGCLHECPYCYARDIAEGTPNKKGLYEQGFKPSFYPSRIHAPLFVEPPKEAERDIGYKNIFTCSMADLFGRWVPTEWIQAVLYVVKQSPQWNFLFLTKFPKRLKEFDFPDNAWVGTTVDCQARVKIAEEAFKEVNAKVKWLSCEPLLEPLEFNSLDMFNWVVIGGSSASQNTPQWIPPREWIIDLENKAYKAGCLIYEKTNLYSLPIQRQLEYPSQERERIELPQSLRYIPTISHMD